MGKRIAIFCDGTWNRADQAQGDSPCPTNVVRLALRVSRRSRDEPQVVYYGQGVGTGGSIDKLTGGAFGKGLDDNLFAAYRFLILNYEPGDQIFLFGFSRGAYTARSLAGMIRKCGILSLRWAERYISALDLYRNGQHPDDSQPSEFRRSYCTCGGQPIPIQFIGVWDTVGALGIPVAGLRALTAGKYQFHDVELSGTVRNAFHALAIDEQRRPFQDARWAYKPKPGQRVEQVWFCGAHSDVGGGYARHEWGLADISFQWMKNMAASSGLGFDEAIELQRILKPDPLGPLHDARKGIYRMLPPYLRDIGTMASVGDAPPGEPRLDPTQSIHDSVLRRWDADPTYRPENLRRYLMKIGDPRSQS